MAAPACARGGRGEGVYITGQARCDAFGACLGNLLESPQMLLRHESSGEIPQIGSGREISHKLRIINYKLEIINWSVVRHLRCGPILLGSFPAWRGVLG